MKNTFIEIKNPVNVPHSSLDTAVERMSELDNISEEMNQNAAQREKEMENTKAWFVTQKIKREGVVCVRSESWKEKVEKIKVVYYLKRSWMKHDDKAFINVSFLFLQMGESHKSIDTEVPGYRNQD